MSRTVRRRPRNALWRVVLLWLLIAAVAYAPVAKAVCGIEHAAVITADLHQDAQTDDGSGSPDDEHDACCDDGLVSMAADKGSVDDRGAGVPAALDFAPASFRIAVVARRIASLGGRQMPPPPCVPVLRRLPKLLI